MTIKLIGAGVGRTGTHALKLALERLLGGTCHHMMEVFSHPAEIPVWHAAALGTMPDWTELLAPYDAIVDFPGASFWRELAEAFPDAPVLLSTRSSAEAWWKSADATIFHVTRLDPSEDLQRAHHEMVHDLFANRFSPGWSNHADAVAAYESHNAAVRATIPAGRLFEYQPGDGWGPLCAALDLPEPTEPFPHTNTTDEFRSNFGLDR